MLKHTIFKITLFLIFSGCIFSQNTSNSVNFDVQLFRTIYNDSTAFKTALTKHFDNVVLPMTALLPISVFTYGRVYNKTFDENSGYLLAVSEVTDFILTFGIKEIVKRPRPFASLSHVRQKDLTTNDPYSFPSGHASTSFAMATMFALRYPKYPQAYAPMYIWSLITAYGRPYLGMHYPSDVLAGAVIGAGSSVLIYSLRKELFKFKNNLFKENKNDDGSINGGVISIFAASFFVSDLLNTYILKSNKLSINISNFTRDNSDVNLLINCKL